MSTRFSRAFDEIYRRCRNDIFEWVRLWNVEPTPQQREVLQAVQDQHMIPPKKRTKLGVCAASGRGTGKTSNSVFISGWRQIRFPGTRTVVTAPNFRQASEIFVGEFRTLLGKAQPILREIFTDLSSKKIKVCGQERWDIICATASDPGKMAGFHDDHLGYIWEECGGIERPIITAMRGSLTNDDAFVYAPGNPISRNSAFYDFFTLEPETWDLFHLNAEESPIISKNFVETMARDFGEESDAYRVHVLGQFPKEDPDGVLAGEDIRACMKTDKMEMAFLHQEGVRNYKQFGIDFARFGSDESIIYQRQGNAIIEWRKYVKTDPNDVVDHSFVMQIDYDWDDADTHFVADAGGMGQGLMANFYRAGKKLVEFHNGGKSADRRFKNRLSEAWFNLRKLVRARQCHLPDDPVLLRQLETRKYSTDRTTGKVIVESKDDYMKRTEMPSPDRADALVYAFYSGGAAAGKIIRPGATPKVRNVRRV